MALEVVNLIDVADGNFYVASTQLGCLKSHL